MKKLLMAAMASALVATPALAADVKIGVLLGFTGPIESLTPDMASGAELAMKEATDSGAFMSGSSVTSVRGDSTCVDAAAATAAAERLITADGVSGIMGADCSGVTIATLQNVAMAKLMGLKHGYRIDANQEMFACGVVSVVCSFFSGYISGPSVSRSLVQVCVKNSSSS